MGSVSGNSTQLVTLQHEMSQMWHNVDLCPGVAPHEPFGDQQAQAVQSLRPCLGDSRSCDA